MSAAFTRGPERTAEQYRADAVLLRARHNHNAANELELRAAEIERKAEKPA